MKIVQVHQPGGPESMRLADAPIPEPGPGAARVRVAASGVNYIDVYFRTGLYTADLPVTPGSEAAGTVDAVGPDVSEVAVGDRVAYAMVRGSYAEYTIVPASQLVTLPDAIDFPAAAAAMLQGMTAHYLTHSTYPVQEGDTVLVHAAAGGAGRLIAQMARARGARVLGTVSTPAKAAVAREAGVHDTILYTEVDFEEDVRRLTDQQGVHVVYDSVGQTTFDKSLGCLRRRGMLVLFGQSSGPVRPLDPQVLNTRGSVYLTRPSLAHYLQDREELLWRAGDVLDAVASGRLRLHIDRTYPLADAASAHRDLESRRTTGKLLLIPDPR
jgi:NADPH:quinone reductase